MKIEKLKTILYYLFLLLPTLCKGFGFDMGDKIYIICALISCSLFCVKFVLTKWKIKELLIVIPLILLGGITAYVSKKFSIIMAILTIVGAKDIDIPKALKVMCVAWIACFVINVNLALFGVIDADPNCNFPVCTNENAHSFGLGYGHKNQLAIACIITLLSYIYLRYEKMKWYEFVPVFAYIAYISHYADSETAMIMLAFIPLLLLLSKIKGIKKLLNIAYKCIPLFCLIFSFLTSILYGEFRFLEVLNKLFTTRINLGQIYLKAYPFSLFGNEVEKINGLFLDNGYIYLYCTFGILIFALFIIGYQLLIHYLIKHDKAKELMMTTCFLMMGIVEQFFSNPYMNISIILIAYLLYDYKKEKNVEKIEK